MDAEVQSLHKRRWSLIGLALITLAGFALRVTNIGESLWLDELHTGWVVKDAWSDVAWRAQIGNQSPVWFYAVKLVTALGGESELTLRLLSLVAGTALIPATYWLVHLLMPKETSGSPLACVLASSLIAIDPNCIFYATEARAYACLQLCAALQLGLFWQILQAPTTKLRIGWMLLTALAFHLHYTGILILLGELVVLLGYYLSSRKPVPYCPWRAAFDWQIAAMLCLPAIGHVLEVARRREMWDSMTAKATWDKLLDVFPLYPVTAFGCVLYPIIALALVVGVLALIQRYRGWAAAKPQANWSTIAVIATWLILPLLTAFAVTHYELARVFLRRYLIAFAIGPPLLTALLLTRLPRTVWKCVMAVSMLGLATYSSNIIPQLRYDGRAVGYRDEDWRGAMTWLREQHALDPAPIEIYSGLLEEDPGIQLRILESQYSKQQLQQYLRFPLNSLYDSPHDMPSDDEQASVTRRKWIVSRGSDRGISCILDGYDRATLGCDLIQQRSFGNVHVSQWQRLTADETNSPTSTQSQSSDP
jgi:mannosyltransferase